LQSKKKLFDTLYLTELKIDQEGVGKSVAGRGGGGGRAGSLQLGAYTKVNGPGKVKKKWEGNRGRQGKDQLSDLLLVSNKKPKKIKGRWSGKR